MNDWTRAPADVVRPQGLDDDTLLALHCSEGTKVEIHYPGELVLDANGNPAGMTQPHVATALMGPARLTPTDQARLIRLLAARPNGDPQ